MTRKDKGLLHGKSLRRIGIFYNHIIQPVIIFSINVSRGTPPDLKLCVRHDVDQYDVQNLMKDVIPDLQPQAVKIEEAIPKPNERRINLPESLLYVGYHDRGCHIFLVQSEIYVQNGEEKDSLAIQEAIKEGINDSPFVLIYRNTTEDHSAAYLPDVHGRRNNLFHDLCIRFATIVKLVMTDNIIHYGRLTGIIKIKRDNIFCRFVPLRFGAQFEVIAFPSTIKEGYEIP